jgi:transposase-like protein
MKTKKKIVKKQTDRSMILYYLHQLDDNEMNISFIAKRVGVNRTTIFRWKRKYWSEYLIRENEIKNQLNDIDEVKKRTVKEFDDLKSLFQKLLKTALKRVREILTDPEEMKKLSNRNLIQLISVVAPYAAEKMSVPGSDNTAENMKSIHTAFVQNIARQMNIKGYRKLQENDKKKDQT